MVCGAICDPVSVLYTIYKSLSQAPASRAPKRSIGAVDDLEHRDGGGALGPVMDAENGEAGSRPGARILYRLLVIVLDIGEALIAGRRPFERAALLAGTP